ncbi:MAG: hypothetical protein Kow00127_17720 [Bacteroidales bacterium]
MKTLRLTMILVLLSAVVYAGKFTVDNTPGSGANFSSVGSAISSASSGDKLYLHPSSFTYGDFSLNKSLVFIGPVHLPEYNGGVGAQIDIVTLQNGSSGSKFIGLKIETITCAVFHQVHNIEITNNYLYNTVVIQGPYGDYSDGDNWLIQGNVMIQKEGCGGCKFIDIRSSAGVNSGWIFRNNIIQSVTSNNTVWMFGNFNGSTIAENNIIIHRNSHPLFNSSVSGGEFRNNIFWASDASFSDLTINGSEVLFDYNLTYHSSGVLTALPGANNIDNTDPEFEYLTDDIPDWNYENIYMLSETSPGSGAGSDGTDMGVYGALYPFRMEGYPQDFPRFRSVSVSNTIVPQGQTIQIHLNAVRAGL